MHTAKSCETKEQSKERNVYLVFFFFNIFTQMTISPKSHAVTRCDFAQKVDWSAPRPPWVIPVGVAVLGVYWALKFFELFSSRYLAGGGLNKIVHS
jgi:hypothetical protein